MWYFYARRQDRLLMARFLVLTFLTFGFFLTAAARQIVPFNEGWKFFLGDPEGAESMTFSDRDWEEVRIPHDWAIAGPFDPMVMEIPVNYPGAGKVGTVNSSLSTLRRPAGDCISCSTGSWPFPKYTSTANWPASGTTATIPFI